MEWGDSGAGAFEAVGEMLSEAAGGEDATKAICARLAAALNIGGCAAAAAPPPPVAERRTPLVMGALTATETGGSLGKLARGVITACTDGADVDEAKATKRRTREEAKAAEAYAKHLAELAAAAAGDKATVVRNAGSGGSKDVTLENLVISNGGEVLVEDGSLTLAHGRRYGLIGRNGTGKSTLLRAIANRSVAGLSTAVQVLHVEQEVTGDETSVLNSVLEADGERTALLAEEQKLLADSSGSGSDRLSNVYARLLEIDAYTAEARAAAILAGLSFPPDAQQRPTRSFSGGWRMRVALARALFVVPDLLLLDEPTNHLDLSAVIWLEATLQAWPTTLLLVSHARDFLDNVCSDIIHLHSRRLTAFKGNYMSFEMQRAERARCSEKSVEREQRKKKHMQAFLDKFGALLRQRAKLVQNRMARLEAQIDRVGVFDDPEYCFRFPEPLPVNPPVIGFHDVTFAYPGAPSAVFKHVNFGFDLDSRVALVGPNGVGKTTLLNLMNGLLSPQTGHVARNNKVRIASFSQHHVDDLDMTLTPLTYMQGCFSGVAGQDLRNHLGSFGIGGTLATQTIFTLSGGQKSRVALAKITWSNPHIMLLDEVRFWRRMRARMHKQRSKARAECACLVFLAAEQPSGHRERGCHHPGAVALQGRRAAGEPRRALDHQCGGRDLGGAGRRRRGALEGHIQGVQAEPADLLQVMRAIAWCQCAVSLKRACSSPARAPPALAAGSRAIAEHLPNAVPEVLLPARLRGVQHLARSRGVSRARLRAHARAAAAQPRTLSLPKQSRAGTPLCSRLSTVVPYSGSFSVMTTREYTPSGQLRKRQRCTMRAPGSISSLTPSMLPLNRLKGAPGAGDTLASLCVKARTRPGCVSASKMSEGRQ
jgi:ATP-binding cassette subfamily F protein 3